MRRLSFLVLLVSIFAVGLFACDDSPAPDDESCAKFKLIEGETYEPSVVKVYFQIKTCGGLPITGRNGSDFVIREDGKDVSPFESDQAIITDPNSFQLATLLLLDMSGSITGTSNLDRLQDAASTFVDRVAGQEMVAIYTYDGREDLQSLIDFTNDVEALDAAIDSLSDYQPVDKSTNFNGAVINGLRLLDDHEQDIRRDDVLFAGSLVIFTDGSDQAARVSDEEAVIEAQQSTHSVFTVGLGVDLDQKVLKAIASDGHYWAQDVTQLRTTFDTIATDIVALSKSFYILAYCSLKRSDRHLLQLALADASGKLEFEFDAYDFDAGCSASNFMRTSPADCNETEEWDEQTQSCVEITDGDAETADGDGEE